MSGEDISGQVFLTDIGVVESWVTSDGPDSHGRIVDFLFDTSVGMWLVQAWCHSSDPADSVVHKIHSSYEHSVAEAYRSLSKFLDP